MFFKRNKLVNKKKQKNQQQKVEKQESKNEQVLLSTKLQQNLSSFHEIYKDCTDAVFREFVIGGKRKAAVIYIDGLSNEEELDENVLAPLMDKDLKQSADFYTIFEEKLSVIKVKQKQTVVDCVEFIGSGFPVLLIDGESKAFALGLPKWERRGLEEPQAEAVIRGPRQGFTETLQSNTALLRRIIKSPRLKMKALKIGKYTDTQVVVSYIEGLVDKTLIEEIENRLNQMDIDGVLESGYIEEFIEDEPFSPFPQILNTERPDVAAAHLLEGRAVILVDNTPFVLIVPITLYSLLHASEDYYERFVMATLIRWLRYIFFLIALLLPSLYVAVLSFHQEMIPTKLLISVAASREQVPFPALIEVLLMEITFEALREAGLRLPKQVGSAVSIVGALVIGEAAVSAGLVSAPMVIVVAITGIASFTIPRYSAAISLRMLRFPMIFLAGFLGLLGIVLGIIMIVIHLCTLRSFGVPFLAPMAPLNNSELKDVLIRAPWWSLNKRPHFTGKYNKYRQSRGQKPSPSKGGE